MRKPILYCIYNTTKSQKNMPLWLCHLNKLGYFPRQPNPSELTEPFPGALFPSPPGLWLQSCLPAASAAPPRKSQPQMKPFGQRRRQDVCQGSLRGCDRLCSVKQRGAARCKLVLSPLSLWQLLCPRCQLLLLLLSPCSRPGPALLLGTSRDSRVPKASRVHPRAAKGEIEQRRDREGCDPRAGDGQWPVPEVTFWLSPPKSSAQSSAPFLSAAPCCCPQPCAQLSHSSIVCCNLIKPFFTATF